MAHENKPKVMENPKAGLCSRIDYLGEGFRQGLLDVGFELFKREGTHFNVLIGGLVSLKATQKRIDNFIKAEIRKDKIAGKKYENFERFKTLLEEKKILKNELRQMRKDELKNQCLRQIAKELSEIIPSLVGPDPENPSKTKPIELFIVTSPAFDGEDGETIAHMLADLRPSDIKVWRQGSARFPIKYIPGEKFFWALAPQRAVWMRGDYYSTAVERVIKDKTKATTQTPPELYVVGCFGSSINKPRGELKYSYASVPNLSRIEETRVSENQVGVSILEFPLDGSQYLFRTQSLKDVLAKELSYIVPPPRCSELQKSLIEIIKHRGSAPPGVMRGDITKLTEKEISKEEVVTAMEGLMKKKTVRRKRENWPGIVYHSSNYYFDLDWIQRRLKYHIGNGPYCEDRIVSAACIHAGSTETDYPFLVNEVPKIILSHNAKIFVACGDIKEGLKHNLDKKGEIIAGAGKNTTQDKLAAHFIGTTLFRSFAGFFERNVAKDKDGKIRVSMSELANAVNKNLVDFVYWVGNHDAWESEDGHEPLEVFHLTLVSFLIKQLGSYLNSMPNLPATDLREIVESKVMRRDFFELPSGLKVSLQHPFMSRAKTTSIRPQEMMDYGKRHGCQVTIGANFHVGENVEEWDQVLGQCVSQEIGTLKHGSNFERRKMKMVDQGVGYLRIVSKNKRILMTESAYYGAKEVRPPVSNLEILNAWVEKLGVPLIEEIPIKGEPLK